MSSHPPTPAVIHQLAAAPHFVGRSEEVGQLRAFWQAGRRGVLALVGLGGSGKTAVMARFLHDHSGPLPQNKDGPSPPARLPQGREKEVDGLLVWSFYLEPDAGLFLQEAYRYFARQDPGAVPGRGAGLLHLLREALAVGGPHLIVLDGLERVQHPGDGVHPFGQIEDPLLRGLLTRIAEAPGNTTVLVTSRFPLSDLEAYREGGYRCIDVGGLDRNAAHALLRARGVVGDEAALDMLIENYGGHALTLDHLGGLIGQFFDGDPGRAPQVAALDALAGDRQALRLARLLRAYEENLPPEEVALLCRLCVLRRSATAEQLRRLFLCTPAVRIGLMRDVVNMVLYSDVKKQLAAELLEDLGTSVAGVFEEYITDSPLAGPEEQFVSEVGTAIAALGDAFDKDMEWDYHELARVYQGKEQAETTPRLPLTIKDREFLSDCHQRYTQLLNHPLYPYRKKDEGMEFAFQAAGYKLKRPKGRYENFGPSDIMRALQNVCRGLCFLAAKHLMLRLVHELCRNAQRKWELAGPLASLEAADLDRILDSLVRRHLILRESDHTFSVHPAVRDHFHRLATAKEPQRWHDQVREQLISLVRQPGKRLPEDAATLGLIEEAIHHTLQAGKKEEAWKLFNEVLGGLRHLAWKLGELARGLRILRAFEPCPDPWSLGWFLRGLGELEEAYRHNPLPAFRADIRLLQGRLPEVAREGDEARTAAARFLMGETTDLPPDTLVSVIPREQLLVYLGRLDLAGRVNERERLFRDMGLEAERARSGLVLADIWRRQNYAPCQEHLGSASAWVLRSGSVEHLCLMHLVQARIARDNGDSEAAQRALTEGLHIARQCGLGLYLIELLCEQAEVCLARADAPAAEGFARVALERAQAVDCRFRWGAAAAAHLLGQVFIAQQRWNYAEAALTRARNLRKQIGDPRLEQTERLLVVLGAHG